MDGVRTSTLGTGALADTGAYYRLALPDILPGDPGVPAPVPSVAVAPTQAAVLFAQGLQATAATGMAPLIPSTVTIQGLGAPQAFAPAATLQAAPQTPRLDATGASVEFALQTALRFGAGVPSPGTPPVPAPALAAGPIRDAVAVLRAEAPHTQTGGTGPEAFARSPLARESAHAYRALTAPATSGGTLDLLA